ncbi:FAD-binding domain-containing protein [Aspergillus homomorphus CBS 101889]|uniref:FAD-binding domain-containing protein n=1 Tax=Aspergillus homomorphus (strain CBS 101889) TaxID=1450537 RepID=A0A395HYH0_ASPHC|nr:FAD-binding domain-containing protein [Aspergillus homomorphus CBS 101889]RAL12840.1 FAD-binding domain-containing protein [Aspergillus homomorphus CBS 101889]
MFIIKPALNMVTFGAGWDLIDLIPALRDEDLQVHNLGSEMVQNYIGAVTTGAHGKGKQHQDLAMQIIGFRVLDAQGNIHSMDKATNPDLVKAFSIGIGALGIVVEPTIQAEALSYLKRTMRVVQGSSNITELPHARLVPREARSHPEAQPQRRLLGTEQLQRRAELLADSCANDCGSCDRGSVCYDYKNFQNLDIAAKKSKGCLSDDVTVITRFIKADDNWLSSVNADTLPKGSRGIFASLKYSWIPTYNGWTQQYFYQDQT